MADNKLNSVLIVTNLLLSVAYSIENIVKTTLYPLYPYTQENRVHLNSRSCIIPPKPETSRIKSSGQIIVVQSSSYLKSKKRFWYAPNWIQHLWHSPTLADCATTWQWHTAYFTARATRVNWKQLQLTEEGTECFLLIYFFLVSTVPVVFNWIQFIRLKIQKS